MDRNDAPERQHDWTQQWTTKDGFPLFVETTEIRGKTMHRVRIGQENGCGAAALALTKDPEKSGIAAYRVLMVRQYRHCVGRTLWELARGMTEKSDPDTLYTAQRELWEETSVWARQPLDLGFVYPDTGMLESRVRLVAFLLTPEEAARAVPDAVEVDACRWFTVEEIRTLIREGRCRDSFSLSAFLLFLDHLAPEFE